MVVNPLSGHPLAPDSWLKGYSGADGLIKGCARTCARAHTNTFIIHNSPVSINSQLVAILSIIDGGYFQSAKQHIVKLSYNDGILSSQYSLHFLQFGNMDPFPVFQTTTTTVNSKTGPIILFWKAWPHSDCTLIVSLYLHMTTSVKDCEACVAAKLWSSQLCEVVEGHVQCVTGLTLGHEEASAPVFLDEWSDQQAQGDKTG